MLTYTIAIVWLVNGLCCKVLGLVPRHQQIVGRILGEENAPQLTLLIGLAEMGMAAWIIIGVSKRFCSLLQVVIILTMNILELYLANDLLLFGKLNIVVAVLFSGLILWNYFHFSSTTNK